jgi:hypothetical protein
MDAVRPTHFLSFALLNAFYNFEDYSSPITTYLESFNDVSLVKGVAQAFQKEILINEVKSQNYLFYSDSPKTETFYSLDASISKLNNYEASNKPYIEAIFSLSNRYDVYERNVYTIFDMLGQLGGVFEILFILGSYVVPFISRKMFYNSLISDLYYVEEEDREAKDSNGIKLTSLTKISSKVNPKLSKTKNYCDEMVEEDKESSCVNLNKDNYIDDPKDNNTNLSK